MYIPFYLYLYKNKRKKFFQILLNKKEKYFAKLLPTINEILYKTKKKKKSKKGPKVKKMLAGK